MAKRGSFTRWTRRRRFVSVASRDEIKHTIRLLAPRTTEHELIRIGGPHDGGYLVPNDLGGIAACFSPGVSDIADFELDFVSRGIPCFLADASIDKSPVTHELLTFDRLWLGAEDDDARNTVSLDTWVTRHAPQVADGDLVLQMDIEDAEWATLLATSDATLARFRVIVLELHDLTSLGSKKGNAYIRLLFEKLARQFVVVHAHPNNCCARVNVRGVAVHPVLEITLLRRDRISSDKPTTRFPHPLDAPNVVGRPDVKLRPVWYRQ